MEQEVMDLAPTPVRDGEEIAQLLGKKRLGLDLQSEWAEPLLKGLAEGKAVTSSQLCRLVGCSYRKIDYWCRTGLISPVKEADGSGSQRLFDGEAVRQARIITRLTAIGVSPSILRKYGVDTGALLLTAEVQSVVEDLVE